MQQYTQALMMNVLTRLQNQHSTHFKQGFTYFLSLLFALPSVGPNYTAGVFEQIQPG